MSFPVSSNSPLPFSEAQTAPLSIDQALEDPKRYIGYAEYTKFLATEDNFCILRRFDRSNIRVLLSLQDEIRQLEQALDKCDDAMSKQAVNNGSLRNDPSDERRCLIGELSRKLEHYNRFLHIYSLTRALPAAKRADIEHLKTWLYNHGHWSLSQQKIDKWPIEDSERGYLSDPDLVALVPDRRSPARRFLEHWRVFRYFKGWRKLVNPFFKPTYDDENLVLTNDERIDFFVALFILYVGIAMLIAPLWILAYVPGTQHRLIVITSFISVFLFLVSLGTTAKPYDALAATAGYSAVLMVFLQTGEGGI
ncbi:hypothetical protein BJX64DRAFT_292389 [Aspergillus heterothallicus]